MTDRKIKKAEDIFYSAAGIKSVAERERFLGRECVGDRELRAVVDQWLAVQPRAEQFFQGIDAARVLDGDPAGFSRHLQAVLQTKRKRCRQ